MSLFSPTPVLSIVVPYQGDDAAFEATLVSVLENRPRRCEVLVPHDGHYHDPFDLSDEVRFAIAPTDDLPSLLLAAAAEANGRITHCLADGNQATRGWTEGAVDRFEEANLAAVAPQLLRPERHGCWSLGWSRRGSLMVETVATARRNRRAGRSVAIDAPHLNASFWQTDVLRAVAEVPHAGDAIAASIGWMTLARQAGMRCESDAGSQLRGGLRAIGPISGTTAGRLAAIASADEAGGLAAALHCAASLAVQPSRWNALAGGMRCAIQPSRFEKRFRQRAGEATYQLERVVESAARPATIRMPVRSEAPVHLAPRRAA